MKKIRSILAVLLSAAMVLSLSACHPKDEVAVTATNKESKTEVSITTAQYLYALTLATTEAQSIISQNNPDEEIEDFSKYKVVETDENDKETKTEYYKWINNHAENVLREYAGTMIKQKDLKLELDESTQAMVDAYGQMYWNYYYQPTFEKNGVGQETYTKMFAASYYKNEYFLSIYDKDGTEAIAEKEVEKTFKENYTLGNQISIQVVEESSEDSETETEGLTMKEANKLLKSYKERMENGESFEEIYKEYTEKYVSTDDEESEATADDAATVYGSEDTSYSSPYFSDVNKMKKNAVKVIKSEDETEIILVEKQDINDDEATYFDSYRSDVLYMLKGDEFEENFNKFCDGLKLEYVESATNRIKAKKINVSTGTEEDHTGHDHE